MRLGRRGRAEPSVRIRELEAVSAEAPAWRAPWPVLAPVAAVLTALVGWLLILGFCMLGWITVPEIDATAVLRLGTQGWLLANGISVALPGAQLSIMPLGLTLLVGLIAFLMLHQVVIHSAPPSADVVGRRVLRVGALFAITYSIVLGSVRAWSEGDLAANSSLVGGLVLAFALGLTGAARALDWQPPAPRLVGTVLRGLAAGLAVMVVAGALAMGVAVWSGRDRITLIHDSLQAGALGGAMLLLGQLAWLPNFVLWSGAWTIGAGVQLGVDTVISPAQSLVGMLPAIPVLGAVPPAGPVPRPLLGWVASGAVAGVVAALVVVRALLQEAARRGRRPGVDLTAVTGAVIGVLTGLLFTALQVPASGDLGGVRLLDLGARIGALMIMAPTSMGLAGLVTGALLGWRAARSRPAAPDPGANAAGDDEAAVSTRVIDG